MQNIHVRFGIRLRSAEVISAIGDRANRVLGCPFTPSQDPDYPDEIILQAEVFCLRLTISRARVTDNLQPWIYQLHGENIVEPRWDYSEKLNLTAWLLQEFRRRDSPDWYVPTLDELKQEAGIA